MKRNIIIIDEAKCNGCGLCIPNCPEGALGVIDGKARVMSDLFCDGLGACIEWCAAARECVGEKLYARYLRAKEERGGGPAWKGVES